MYAIALALGIHEDTLRLWLNRPEAQFVVVRCAHKQAGWYHNITSGTLFAVKLYPDGETRPKLAFERGLVFRDLESAREQGKVRDTYTPEGKSLFQVLMDWINPVDPEEDLAPVNDARTPVENPAGSPEDSIRDALSAPVAQTVEQAAHAIVRSLGDTPRYLPAWCRLLWSLAKGRDPTQHSLFTLTFTRFRTAHQQGLRSAAPQLLRESQGQ